MLGGLLGIDSGTSPVYAQSLGSRTEIFTGQGFDTCEIPTLSQMQTWITHSPYDVVNLYIGGSCRACPNSALTASYVSELSQQGWKFIPTWVGPQSDCWSGSCGSSISNDPATAYNQGLNEANAAIDVAISLGLASADGSGTIIYYDLEAYDTSNAACHDAAKSFISGWTAQIHAKGSLAGVYGYGPAINDFAGISNVPDAIWPAHWIYDSYNSGATVWDVYGLSNSLWANHQRIRQYAGGVTETYGSVTLNIDCNVIDGIVATIAQQPSIDLSLVSLHTQSFPFIYLTVRASSDGQPVSNLTKDNFSVTEDGRLQTDMFDVVPPDEGGEVRMADIVFLIDNSGSMSTEIAAVKNNCEAFADALAASEIDYRLGLVQFGQSANGGHPRLMGSGLTGSVSEFKSWVGTMPADGGYEYGFEAIRLAIQSYSFRPGTQKVFILITDEDSDDRNKQSTIDMILANDVTVHVAANCGYGTSQADYCGTGSVRDVSGGLLFPVTGDYRSILDTIGEAVADAYIVRYRTDNPVFDGLERTVVCTVQDGAASDFVQCTYIPGGTPNIQRTEETLALHQQSLVAASSPTISVEVTDAAAPFVENVLLYVRTSGSGTGYVQVSMLPQGSDIYSATVPGSYVNAPGLDYYVRATDGQTTSWDPTTDPDKNPYQIAVLPNEAPIIFHTPPTSWQTGTDIDLEIVAFDSTYGIASLVVYYCREGDLLWQCVSRNYDPIVNSISEIVVLPVAAWDTEVVKYYIKVTDDLGVSRFSPEGASKDPYLVNRQTEQDLLISELNGLRSMVHTAFDAYADTLAEVMVKVVSEEEADMVDLVTGLLLFAINDLVELPPELSDFGDFAYVTKDATMAMIEGLDFVSLKAIELWGKDLIKLIISEIADLAEDPNGISLAKDHLVEKYLTPYEQEFDDQYAALIQQLQQSPPAPETLISMREQVKRFSKWMEKVCYQEDDLVYLNPSSSEAQSAIAGAIHGYITQVDDTIYRYNVIGDSITKTKYAVWGGALLLKAGGWLCTGAGIPIGPVTEHAGLMMIKTASIGSIVAETITFANELLALTDIAADAYTTFAADVLTLCITYEAALDLMGDFPEEITGEVSIDAVDPSNPQCTVDPPAIEPTSPWTAEVGVDICLTSPVTSTGTVLLEVIYKDEVLSVATYGGIDLEPNQTRYLTYTVPFPAPTLCYVDEAELSVVCYAGIYGDEGADIIGPRTSLFKIVKPGAYSGHVISNSVSGELGTGEIFSLPLATPNAASTLMVSLEYGGSELDIHLHDNHGGHVGMDYATGNVEIGIPGASYSGPKAAHEWISVEGIGLTEYSVKVVCVFSESKTDFSLSYLFTLADQTPIADAGPDQIVCVAPPATAAEVILGGSGSYDPDGDPMTYNWTWDGNTAYGVNATAQLPLGTTTIILAVNDGIVDSVPDAVNITVSSMPIAIASSNSPVSRGATIRLYGNPYGMTDYSWSGPGGWTSELQNPTRPSATTTMAGTYSLVVTNEHGCTSDPATTNVEVRVSDSSGGGGDGGGGGGYTETKYLTVDWEGKITEEPLYSNDKLKQDLLGLCPDGCHSLLLEQGTHAPTVDGKTHYLIVIRELEERPPLPDNTEAIVAIEVIPNGAVFNKDIFLTLGVPELPANALDVTMAYYDDIDGVWVPMESETGGPSGVAELTLSAAISHFSIFGVLAELEPTTPPQPASFVASGLNIIPSVEKTTFVTKTGESVTITANVANNGGQGETYTVELKLNGETLDTKTVTLGAGQSQQVSFTLSEIDYGQYEVEVAGLSGEFTSSRTITWWLIIVIIVAIGLITSGVIWGIKRRRRATAQEGNNRV